ncbi:MAG TPA: hypothetical protein VLM80_05770 [Anaerolineales bacterium]|nr:hypothetical protein [Anaerolineales bacterium]
MSRLKLMIAHGKTTLWMPALVVFLLAASLVGLILVQVGGDAMYFVRIGTYFSQGDPQGSKGYDGQFTYAIARELQPQSAARYLDVPAYRYQRILMPILARLLSLGNLDLLPWVLLLIGLVSLAAVTLAVAAFMVEQNVSAWYALVLGLFPGMLLALIVDLPEPLAYALAAWGLVWLGRAKNWLAWICLGLAVFAKEVMLIFVAAAFLDYIGRKDYRSALGLILITAFPFVLFQLWLFGQFGHFGIGSGGDMATPFEWIPFMGLMRIAAYSLPYFLAMLLVFGPSILLPAIWGLWVSFRTWIQGERNVIVLALGLNALSILAMPFSTFRETGGLLRYMVGLVLMVLLFAGRYQKLRVLNYSVFWLVLNVFLLKGW